MRLEHPNRIAKPTQDRDTWITSSVLFARPALMACVAMFAGRLSRWGNGEYRGALILLGGVLVSGVCAAFCFLTAHTPLVVIALLVGAQVRDFAIF